MTNDNREPVRATGGCLCGSVRFRIRGALRDVTICHCQFCQRMNTYAAAYTSCAPPDLELVSAKALRWYRSSPELKRGFCGKCGSALFWEHPSPAHISISVGSLNPPTGLKLKEHKFEAQRGDYEAAAGAT